MSRNNKNLHTARSEKNDEFYTQYRDIQREMNAYLEYNPDVFRNKTILLPCDDPEWSNFTKFFAQNFENFGIKKLISTSYAIGCNDEPSLFELQSPKYDEIKSKNNGKIFTLCKDYNNGGVVDINNLKWDYLEGTGDFRSEEVMCLHDEADIIITNPPFSLFREFITWIMNGNKQFIIVGNLNAVSYKEVFPLIKDNKVWLGVSPRCMYFTLPNGETKEINSTWFTNIEHGYRHQLMQLMTMEDNLKFSKHKEIKKFGYLKYDNYDAIDVPYSDAIPSDFDGIMAVPITFLDRYNPDQFEIIGEANCGINNEYNLFTPIINGKYKYKRILIRKK